MEEIEAKYRLSGPAAHDAVRARLRALGAVPCGTVGERNVLYDRPDGALLQADQVLRLRWLDDATAATLTYKGPAAHAGALKRREEREVTVADGAALAAILAALGYQPRVEYAKRRETWRLGDAEVALDTLAFGWFCEIEGSAESVPRVAAALGLSSDQAEPRGYPALAAAAAREGINPLALPSPLIV